MKKNNGYLNVQGMIMNSILILILFVLVMIGRMLYAIITHLNLSF